MPPALELVNVTKRFGSFVANDKISLKVPPGTFTRSSAKTAPAKARW